MDIKIQNEWLSVRSFPDDNTLFSLPLGVYFLVQTRPELWSLDVSDLKGRIFAFMWWEGIGSLINKGVVWRLSEAEVDCVRQIYVDWREIPQRIYEAWLRANKSQLPLEVISQIAECNDVIFQGQAQISPSESLPTALQSIYLARPDLQNLFDIDDYSGIIAFVHWWHNAGYAEYRLIKDFKFNISFGDGFQNFQGFRLPNALMHVFHLSEKLGHCRGVTTNSDAFKFIDWWFKAGRFEYGFIQFDATALLESLIGIVKEEGFLPLPLFLYGIHEARFDISKLYDLKTQTGRAGLYDWWFANGYREYPFIEFDVDGAIDQFFNDGCFNVYTLAEDLPDVIIQFRSMREDLLRLFPLATNANRSDFASWCNTHGKKELWILSKLHLEYVGERWILTPDAGVNVIGFPRGILGIGEDARAMGATLEFSGIPYVYVEAPISGPVPEHFPEVEAHLGTERFPFSIITLPPTDLFRIALESDGQLFNHGRYIIAAMPWELPSWPVRYAGVFDLIDEIWAPSEYVASTLGAVCGNKPVVRMPMVVTVPEQSSCVRGKYGFTAQDFVFYVMFDGGSWLTRKNPMAGVKAFCDAFPPADFPSVRLLVKAMNVQLNNPIWADVIRRAEEDQRIVIEPQKMSRQELIDLMASCNCYVSLHRSEGFGRIMAEAMLLDQPVIATNYSGNVDFCTDETAFLVDGPLISLEVSDYPLAGGQLWCDPNHEMAVLQMRSVFENIDLRDQKAMAGKLLVETRYSLKAVAAAQRLRFNELGLF